MAEVSPELGFIAPVVDEVLITPRSNEFSNEFSNDRSTNNTSFDDHYTEPQDGNSPDAASLSLSSDIPFVASNVTTFALPSSTLSTPSKQSSKKSPYAPTSRSIDFATLISKLSGGSTTLTSASPSSEGLPSSAKGLKKYESESTNSSVTTSTVCPSFWNHHKLGEKAVDITYDSPNTSLASSSDAIYSHIASDCYQSFGNNNDSFSLEKPVDYILMKMEEKIEGENRSSSSSILHDFSGIPMRKGTSVIAITQTLESKARKGEDIHGSVLSSSKTSASCHLSHESLPVKRSSLNVADELEKSQESLVVATITEEKVIETQDNTTLKTTEKQSKEPTEKKPSHHEMEKRRMSSITDRSILPNSDMPESPSLPPRALPDLILVQPPIPKFGEKIMNTTTERKKAESANEYRFTDINDPLRAEERLIKTDSVVLEEDQNDKIEKLDATLGAPRTPNMASNETSELGSHLVGKTPDRKLDWQCSEVTELYDSRNLTQNHYIAASDIIANKKIDDSSEKQHHKSSAFPSLSLRDRWALDIVGYQDDTSTKELPRAHAEKHRTASSCLPKHLFRDIQIDEILQQRKITEEITRSGNQVLKSGSQSDVAKDVPDIVDKRFHQEWLSFCRRQTIARAYEVENDLTGPAMLAANSASKFFTSLDSFPPPLQFRRVANEISNVADTAKPSSMTTAAKRPTHFVAVLILCLEDHDVPKAAEAISQATAQFRLERKAAYEKGLAEYFRATTEKYGVNDDQRTAEEFPLPQPPTKHIQLDFNVVGTFGTRVLFTTTSEAQQKILQLLHDRLVEHVVSAGLQVVGLEEESGICEAAPISAGKSGESKSPAMSYEFRKKTSNAPNSKKKVFGESNSKTDGLNSGNDYNIEPGNDQAAVSTDCVETTQYIDPGTPTSSIVSLDKEIPEAFKNSDDSVNGDGRLSTCVGVHGCSPDDNGSNHQKPSFQYLTSLPPSSQYDFGYDGSSLLGYHPEQHPISTSAPQYWSRNLLGLKKLEESEHGIVGHCETFPYLTPQWASPTSAHHCSQTNNIHWEEQDTTNNDFNSMLPRQNNCINDSQNVPHCDSSLKHTTVENQGIVDFVSVYPSDESAKDSIQSHMIRSYWLQNRLFTSSPNSSIQHSYLALQHHMVPPQQPLQSFVPQPLIGSLTTEELALASQRTAQQQSMLLLAFSNQAGIIAPQQSQQQPPTFSCSSKAVPFPSFTPINNVPPPPPPPCSSRNCANDLTDDALRRYKLSSTDVPFAYNGIVGSVPAPPSSSALRLRLNGQDSSTLAQKQVQQAQYMQQLQKCSLLQQPQATAVTSSSPFVAYSQFARQHVLFNMNNCGFNSAMQQKKDSQATTEKDHQLQRERTPSTTSIVTNPAATEHLLALYDKSDLVGAVCASGYFYPHLTIMKTSQGLRRIKNRKKKKMLKILPEYFHEEFLHMGSFGTQEFISLDFLEMTSQDNDGYYHRLITYPITIQES